MVQPLRIFASKAGDASLIPGWGTKISQPLGVDAYKETHTQESLGVRKGKICSHNVTEREVRIVAC